MNIKQLKKLVEQTVKEIRQDSRSLHENNLRKSLRKAKWLIEGEDPEKKEKGSEPPPASETGYAIVNPSTNLSDLNADDAYQQLVSGNENMPMVKAMRNSTDWSDDAISKAGGAPGIKKWANSLGDGEFHNRVQNISSVLPSASLPSDLEKTKNSEEGEQSQTMAQSPKELSDAALGYITSEKLNDSPVDYGLDINVGASVGNHKLTPTSPDIKAGKSMMFGFLHGSPDSEVDLADMDGAYITSDNEVLDGNHRWAGANIATGGDLQHGNLNVVNGSAADLAPQLTSMGNGFNTEAPAPTEPENSEEQALDEYGQARVTADMNRKMDQIHRKVESRDLVERWKVIAGL